MTTILLDSSVIFDHLNGRDRRTEFLTGLIEQGHTLGCCPLNYTEVYAGLRPDEELHARRFLDRLELFPITAGVAAQAGLLRRYWRQKGHTLSYTDVTIAAVDLANGLPLLTDNRKHFPMPELTLLPFPEPD